MSTSNTHKTIRAIVDFLGLAAFAVGYLVTKNILSATWWLVIGSAVGLAVGFAAERRVAPMPLISGVAALVFGGLALIFHNDAFVKIKPTLINLLFAAGLVGGMATGRNFLKMLLGESLSLPDEAWRTLTWRYAAFFAAMAILNIVVWKTMSPGHWVAFRFPGLLILAVLFSLTQVPFMAKYMNDDAEAPPPPVD